MIIKDLPDSKEIDMTAVHGGTAANFGDFTITKKVDVASPNLFSMEQPANANANANANVSVSEAVGFVYGSIEW